MLRLNLMSSIVMLLTALSVQDISGADLKFAHVFQDNMVLQRGMKVPIWGWTDAEAKVTVNFAGQTKSTTADKNGCWQINLEPMKTSANGQVLTVSDGKKKLQLKDLLVGEVWLCAGQSNMAWRLSMIMDRYPQIRKRLGETDFPLIRFIRYQPYTSASPRKDMNSKVQKYAEWQAFNSSTVESSMGLPFFFARKLYKELKVPVGLIQVAVGGTPQTAWCPREVIDQIVAKTGTKATYEFLYGQALKHLTRVKQYKTWEEYEKHDVQFQQQKKIRYRNGGTIVFPCVLYNAMIHPLAPFAFRGVIWHQGEGGPAYEHAKRMRAMVTYWRKLFKNDFYFLWGGLSRDTKVPPPLAPILKAFYRAQRNLQFLQAQALFGYDSRSVFCDFFDLGNLNTHFGAKDQAGERFSLMAINSVYGKPKNFTGPQLVDFVAKPGEIQMKYTYVGSGLVYKPSIDGISGFILEPAPGESLLWIEPTTIGTDTLVFKHDKITEDSLIYYGFHNNPHETLFSKEGFPASISTGLDKLAQKENTFNLYKRCSAKELRKKDISDLVKFMKKPEKNVLLNITHVRRNAYVFSVESWPKRDKKGVYHLQAYVPNEWNSVAASHQGKNVQLSEIKTGSKGLRTVELDVDINSGPYIIYNKSIGTAALNEADCSRF